VLQPHALPFVLWQPAPKGPGPESLSLHQALDAMQAAVDPLGQQIAPDTPRSIGAGARDEARPHLRANLFVFPAAS